LAETRPEKWNDLVSYVVKSHNIAPLYGPDSACPRELFLGMPTRLQLDRLCDLGNEAATVMASFRPLVTGLREELNREHREAKGQKADGNMRNHNAGLAGKPTNPYKVGDWVLVEKLKKAGIEAPRTGPYMVLAVPSPQYCIVRRKMWGQLKDTPLNISQLSPFHWRKPVRCVDSLVLEAPAALVVAEAKQNPKGWGVFSTRALVPGENLGSPRGELIPAHEFRDRDLAGSANSFEVEVGGEPFVLDTRDVTLSNWAAFLACAPQGSQHNVRADCVEETVKLTVVRPVEMGGELTLPTRRANLSSQEVPAELGKPREEPEEPAALDPPQAKDIERGGPERKGKSEGVEPQVEGSNPWADVSHSGQQPLVGDKVIFVDQHSPRGWALGEVTMVELEDEGGVEVWWQDAHPNQHHKPLSQQRFQHVWEDTQRFCPLTGNCLKDYGNSAKFYRKERKGNYRKMIFRVPKDQILISGVGLKRGCLGEGEISKVNQQVAGLL